MSQEPPRKCPVIKFWAARAVEDREHAADAVAQRARKLVPGYYVRSLGDGSIACVYINVGKDADLPGVAADLRNHGATILLMMCDNEEAAETMATLLSNPGVDKKPLRNAGSAHEKPLVKGAEGRRGL